MAIGDNKLRCASCSCVCVIWQDLELARLKQLSRIIWWRTCHHLFAHLLRVVILSFFLLTGANPPAPLVQIYTYTLIPHFWPSNILAEWLNIPSPTPCTDYSADVSEWVLEVVFLRACDYVSPLWSLSFTYVYKKIENDKISWISGLLLLKPLHENKNIHPLCFSSLLFALRLL